MSQDWEYNDGDEDCIDIAEQELLLVKKIASEYPYIKKYNYKPSDFDKNPNDMDEDWSDIKFDNDDFINNNVNEDNYRKVDAVAFDMKEYLIEQLQKHIDERDT